MDQTAKNNVRISISEDSMSAELYLSSAPDSQGISHTEEFTPDNILQLLSEAGVKAGIDKELVQRICIEQLFDRPHQVAVGHPALNGKDGFYTYHFRRELDNKPKLLPDGSVDYHNVDIYEPVKQGDLIAEYTPPSPAHFGYNVKGAILSATPGKGLSPLKGKGFTPNEDNSAYFSDINGKIEMNGSDIIISNILEIKNDVDFTSGNIIFDGDLMIYGNVSTGAIINVTGNVTILGNVEGADIKSGGNVELKSGMQGGGKGRIECMGDLWGKFFELSRLSVGGDVHANSMMNCEVVCEHNVYVSGKHGIIVGGDISCQGNIEATGIGNMAGVRTNINAGVNAKALEEIHNLELLNKDLSDKHLKLQQVLDKLMLIKNPAESEKIETMKTQVSSSMKSLETEIAEIANDLNEKLEQLAFSNRACIKVGKSMFPNVVVELNGVRYHNTSELYNIMLKAKGGNVSVINMTDAEKS